MTCDDCGEELGTDDRLLTIYVRRQDPLSLRWRSVPVCTACWERGNPGRRPVRMRQDPGEGSRSHD